MFTASRRARSVEPAAVPIDASTEPARLSAAPPRGGSLASACGAVFAFVGFVMGSARLGDNSLFTHIATGRLLVHGRLGALWNGLPDPYTTTSHGASWIVQSWLASLFYGVVELAGGGPGLRVSFGVTLAIVCWLVWRLTARAESLIVRVGVAGAVIAVGSSAWSPRPLLFGLIFMALVMLVLDGALHARWLVPAMWVWVNTHGSFPLAVVVIAAAYAGARLDGRDGQLERRVLRFTVLGIVIGGVVNPVGPKMLVFPFALLRRSDVLHNIVEWRSPDFSLLGARFYLLLILAAVGAAMRRPSYRRALPAFVLIACSLLAARNISVALIVIAPILAWGFDGIGTIDGRQRSRVLRMAPLALGLVVLLLVAGMVDRPAYDLGLYPVDGVNWLDAHSLIARDVPLVHQDFVGNYLELRYGVNAGVYFDDRFELHSRDLVADYRALAYGTAGWQRALTSATAVIWERNTAVESLLRQSPEWRIAWQDDKWLIACHPDDQRCA